MKLPPGAPTTACGRPLIAQFSDHEFSHRVVKVSRVKSAAGGLLARIPLIGEGRFAEHLLRFGNAHPPSMQANRR